MVLEILGVPRSDHGCLLIQKHKSRYLVSLVNANKQRFRVPPTFLFST